MGLDPTSLLLSLAREIAEREGVLDRIDFRVGDMRELPFDQAMFDVALAVTALSHATDGERAIPEMARVIRPGGRVGVLDIDYDSWIISHPDRALTRRIGVCASDAVTDGWLARRLPGLFTEAGLIDVQVRAFTPLEQDATGFYARNAEVRADSAVRSGVITEAERQGWLETLRAEQAANRFIGGITHLFVWGRRPER